MNSLNRLMLGAVLFAGTLFLGSAHAELTQVSVGGQIRIRMEQWHNTFYPGPRPAVISPVVRIPASVVTGRPTGDLRLGENIVSYFKWGHESADPAFIQQRSSVYVHADFTDDVAAHIQLENWSVWGEDTFRSNYFNGVDGDAATTNDNMELYQAYIEARDLWGTPVRLRIGRQELNFGSGWLVGNNTNFTDFQGLYFDAARLTYTPGDFTIDAFWAKVAENSAPLGEHQDGDFFGVYGSYAGFENITLDAYWLYLHDSVDVWDTRGNIFAEWIEDLRDIDDYGATHLHTLGLRAAGNLNSFDFELEAAYQFGDAGRLGQRFQQNNYGDDNADFSAFGANAEIGYTLDVKTAPRFFLYGAYFGGEDNRDITLREWLNPYSRPDASISFNRLFSNKVYSYFLDENSYLSNVWLAGGGVQIAPTEATQVQLKAAHYEALEAFDLPLNFRLFGKRVFWTGPLTFLTTPSDTDLGWDINLTASYAYSEDLVFRAGYAHYFLGAGLEDGNFVDLNGLLFNGASNRRDDGSYYFIETELNF
ncbi:MAG: hypothetical protein GC168_05075 [Candidatus Hydrogenedens sp.]|nr:hypothetical protein [Candidatus Hydrogenedens sp.]